MITTEKAAEKLKDELIMRASKVGMGFRVYQTDTKCDSKLALKIDLRRPDDETIELYGLNLFFDPACSSRLKDLKLDYIDGPQGGFILEDLG